MSDRLEARAITDEEAILLANSKDVLDYIFPNGASVRENADNVKGYFICIPDYITDGPGYAGKIFLCVAGALGSEFQPMLFFIKDGEIKLLQKDEETE